MAPWLQRSWCSVSCVCPMGSMARPSKLLPAAARGSPALAVASGPRFDPFPPQLLKSSSFIFAAKFRLNLASVWKHVVFSRTLKFFCFEPELLVLVVGDRRNRPTLPRPPGLSAHTNQLYPKAPLVIIKIQNTKNANTKLKI